MSRDIVSTVELMTSIGLVAESYSEAQNPVEFFEFFLDKLISILRRTNSSGIIEDLFAGVLTGGYHNNKNSRQEPFTS